MRVAHIIRDTDAEGPGRRLALWVQGCSLRCPGCCNPELFSSRGGVERSVSDILAEVAATTGIEGVSVLGGEPVEQDDLEQLCSGVRKLGLTVMLFSGYTRTEIEVRRPTLLQSVDLLVDGRYDRARHDATRRWVGSSNQTLHFLSDAYSAQDPRFASGNTVEFRLSRDGLVVSGWPLWRGRGDV